MRRSCYVVLLPIVVAAFLAAGVASADEHPAGYKFTIKLAPVPGVKTSATSGATFELSKDRNALHYALNASGLEDVTMVHIHGVGGGKPAEILVWLFPFGGSGPVAWEGKFKGVLSAGVITKEQIGGPAKGKSVGDLFEMLEHGAAGVAIHTKKNGGGELWGVAKAK